MAPPKVLYNRQGSLTINSRRGMTTRSQNVMLTNILKPSNINRETRAKRKAEASPPKDKTTKRSAFANITNAITTSLGAQNYAQKKTVSVFKPAVENKQEKPVDMTAAKAAVMRPRPAPRPPVHTNKHVVKKEEKTEVASKIQSFNVRRSADLEKSEDSSLYVSALEDVTDSVKRTRRSNNKAVQVDEKEKRSETTCNEAAVAAREKKTSAAAGEKKTSAAAGEKKASAVTSEKKISAAAVEKRTSAAALLITAPLRKLPENVEWDFDAENWLDPFQVPTYAMDIFDYLKEREAQFPIDDYMNRQVCLSQWMRALLIDWMVEVQESFELNHETLYLAIKLVDLYLTKIMVSKETLQLLGAASLFIASKFDERIPPMVEDFLYICDGAYAQKELIRMEMNVLKVVNFDLGIPLSYRFLRRYARCAKVSMPTLTLARYILEYSLMDYTLITFSDSKVAAAALLLALLMKDLGGWNPMLEYYSGYKIEEIRDICKRLNDTLRMDHKEALTTVRNKYSHKIFFEVAKLPLKETLDI